MAVAGQGAGYYRMEVQLRDEHGWQVRKISPEWGSGGSPVDLAVDAFQAYLSQHGRTLEEVTAPGAPAVRVLVRSPQRGGRPEVFVLRELMEQRVRRAAALRADAERRLRDARRLLRTAVAEASDAGIPQSVLVRLSGWSRETLRRLERNG
ncbi:hypothetical protein [Streptomyces sp. NPDC051572]|uniref:hypothetical protein n=1 Tax=Streptomyces sp. NPDC051572 TaxID=3155802 RepID=UPI00344DC2E0